MFLPLSLQELLLFPDRGLHGRFARGCLSPLFYVCLLPALRGSLWLGRRAGAAIIRSLFGDACGTGLSVAGTLALFLLKLHYLLPGHPCYLRSLAGEVVPFIFATFPL